MPLNPPPGAGTGDMLASNNLSELASRKAAQDNLGLVEFDKKLGRMNDNTLAWDDFDRSDRTLNTDISPTGLTWLVSGPGQAAAAIVRGGTYTNANTYMFLDTGSAVSEFTARFSVNTLGVTAAIMHLAAGTDLNNMLHLQISSTGWSLDKRIASVFTNQIATGGHRLVVSHSGRYEMTIRVSGTTVTIVGVDGLEQSLTVSDIASMGTLTHIGIQSSQQSADDSRFYGVAAGSAIRPISIPDIRDVRGAWGSERRSYSRTLTGAVGWYRLAVQSIVGGTFGVAGKVEISAGNSTYATHGEFNVYGIFSGGMGINKTWSYVRNGGAVSQARISRNGSSPYNMYLDIYKAHASDMTLECMITGIMVEQSTLVGGVSAAPTETLTITF